jgi:phosphoribosylaminoimidazole carboxylase/phosphoribosylaminoimidazole-succinocarboxamide synthase
MQTVTESGLETVKRNFKWVADQLELIVPTPKPRVIILMGSPSDMEHCKLIAKHAEDLGLKPQLRVCSAHKSTEETLRILAEYESSGEKVIKHSHFYVSLKKGSKSNETIFYLLV